MTTPTALVLTHEADPNRRKKSISLIGLAITRSLGRRGIPVVRVHPNRLEHGFTSRYCRGVEVSPNFYDSEDKLVEYLLALKDRYEAPRVLIPASDDCAYFLARHHESLKGAYEIVGPRWSVMESIINKQAQYMAAQRLGIPIPETYFPTDLDEVVRLAGELRNYPYVIKPLVSHKWRLASMKGVSKGKKGFSVKNADELLAQYKAISSGDRNIMIQEVIGGRDERLFTFLSYFNERSEPLAYCIRKKIRQMPVDFGYCTLTVSCSDRTVEEQSIKLLQGVGYHGISGVEWKLDPKNGQYKLIEINARAVNTVGIAPACGVDLPYIAYMDKIKQPLAPVTTWQEGVKWIYGTQDLWSARELHQNGTLSLREWLSSVRGRKVHAVYAADDVKPFIGYFSAFLRRSLGAR